MRAVRIAACVALLTTLVFCEKHFNPPPAAHARNYGLHESHDDEKVTIAIEPCNTPQTAGVFKVNYKGYGLYPVRLIISNDSDSTLMLDDMKIEYITARRDKLEPDSDDDIYRRLVKPHKADQGQPGLKLPFPVGKKKEPISAETIDEYHSAQFQHVPVTAHATNSGYLFFDVLDESPAPGAHLEISGIRAGSKELFYFDIPFEKAEAPAPPAPAPK
ncbi:MAG TPA: hypothetical protein VGN44_06350 [Candidatus Angelobacter sp.]|jgi:hypothetical protein